MNPDIAALRAQAKSFRERADEIDRRVDEFVAWSQSLALPIFPSQPIVRQGSSSAGVSAQPLTNGAPVSEHKRAFRGKPLGTLSMVWRGHYNMTRLFDGNVFPLAALIDQIERRDGHAPRPTAIRRHLKGHIEHGYLEIVGDDEYRMTAKLLGVLNKLPEHEKQVAESTGTSSPQGETGGVEPPASDDDLVG